MYFLTFKEKELPIIVDFGALKNTCSKLSINLTQVEDIINNPAHTEVLVFEALKRGHKIEGKVFDLKESDIEDILSENYADVLEIFRDCTLKMFTPKPKGDSKKKLSTKPDSDFEYSYEYLLSVFVANFSYTKEAFDALTPVEANRIIYTKQEVEANKLDILRNEARLISYFITKSSMGDTSHINRPQDLYQLPIDEFEREHYKQLLEDYQPDPEVDKMFQDYLKEQE